MASLQCSNRIFDCALGNSNALHADDLGLAKATAGPLSPKERRMGITERLSKTLTWGFRQIAPGTAKRKRRAFIPSSSMAKFFSRKTKFKNAYGRAMKVEVRRDPGNFLEFEFVIPSGDYKYMRYEDLHIECNRDRPVNVLVYLEGSREMGETYILPADIRANEKLELNYLNRAITITPTRGHFISRLGLIITLKHVAEQIKSLGK
ncbi:uncharacterized protein LOC132166107 [Corylus avellana]|uniref:uncharacterized protein LOC132166107 n=1 Tax=Corylus avellana TaxID=13451 RepID=UPI00286D3EEC|nr:uncharacterized protein LOC132166107 [Corylus avellana]